MLRDPERAVLLTSDSVIDVPELACPSHEEADTRMFCHMKYVADHFGTSRGVIQSADTDVILMALDHITRTVGLQELWVQKANVFLPCHQIAERLAVHANMDASQITSILMSMYVLTGCDTVSYLYRRGKKRACQTALNCKEHLKPLENYGECGRDLTVTPYVLDAVRLFFIRLYTSHEFNGDLNALRAHLLATAKGDLRISGPCLQQRIHSTSTFSGHFTKQLCVSELRNQTPTCQTL